jgi:hypothetical protein
MRRDINKLLHKASSLTEAERHAPLPAMMRAMSFKSG